MKTREKKEVESITYLMSSAITGAISFFFIDNRGHMEIEFIFARINFSSSFCNSVDHYASNNKYTIFNPMYCFFVNDLS